MPVVIPDAVLADVYKWALAHAKGRARGDTMTADELGDAATDAVLWAIEHCTNADTFRQFAKAAIARWVGRQIGRILKKRENKPQPAGLPEQVEGRPEQPAEPLLIEDLPEEIAFVVRLYMVDGYTCREIGLLTGQSHNTVNLKLKKAAELLAAGRMKKPERRKGEKRLTPG